MFDTKNLLDKLIKVGTDLTNNQNTAHNAGSESSFDPLLKSLLAGVGGGMLGSLLSGNSNALSKLGGGAALATLAYKAYQNYTQNQGLSGDLLKDAQSLLQGFTNPQAASATENNPHSNDHAKALLIAIINAAKADGELDGQEQKNISEEVQKFATDPETLAWVKAEIAKPIDIEALAQYAHNPQMATEIYMTSVLACGVPNEQEQRYLESLKNALNITDGLKQSIEETLFS